MFAILQNLLILLIFLNIICYYIRYFRILNITNTMSSYSLLTDEDLARFGDIPEYVPDTAKEIVLAKLNQIVTTGFTIEEFQKAMILICLIRFVVYSIKYNPITSFKICAIGLFSCVLWGIALNDCVGIYFPVLKFNPLLRNILYEEERFRGAAEIRAYHKVSSDMLNRLAGQGNHFEWLRPIFNLVPEQFQQYTNPAYTYITEDLLGVLKQFYKSNLRQMMPFIIYIAYVRVGKKYCPYHIRWHFTFVTLYNTFVTYIFSCVNRAKTMLYYLIVHARYEEAQTFQLYLGAFVFAHISFVMFAMLHAIFSQYFYVPFITYNVELHIGKRPINSIYSGGYTAWQDDYLFYDIKFRETMRLWWGWLGRGTRKQRRNRRNKKKKK